MPSIEPSVFDFIDEIASEVKEGEPLKSDSTFITFGESFFDQFFGVLGHTTRGFRADAKRRAVAFIHSLPDSAGKAEARRVLVAFEEFCDIRRESQGNYDGYVVDLDDAISLLERIVTAAGAWVDAVPTTDDTPPLQEAISEAASKIEAMQ